MDFSGEYMIPSTKQKVWDALNDPEVLKQCIDGCEELNKESDSEFSARVTAKVGPVRAKFSGKVTLSDIDPPNGYKISGEGQGGVAGFAKGGAAVKLEDSDGGTKLTYTAEAEVGGKLASVGSRLVEGVAKKTADDFFGKFAEIVSIDSKLEDTDTKAAQVQQVAEGSSKTSDNSRLFWGVGVAVAIVAILYTIFG